MTCCTPTPCTHSDTPQKSFCWTPPPKFDEWKDLSLHTEGWRFFFFESTQNKSSQPQKREVFVLKTNTTLSPPKKNKKKQTSTIIYQLTAPHFLKILSSFPPNKHLCYLGLGVVGRSGDGRVASRVDAFPRSLRSSALDLSTTHTTSTI